MQSSVDFKNLNTNGNYNKLGHYLIKAYMCQLSPVHGHVLLVVLDPDVAVDLAVPVDPVLGVLDHAALLKTKRIL